MSVTLTVFCPSCEQTVACERRPTAVLRGEVFARACPHCDTRFTFDGRTWPFAERLRETSAA